MLFEKYNYNNMELEIELEELRRKWTCLLEKLDNLGKVNLFKIVIAKAEKMVAGRWIQIFNISS